mgnify:CR=1 FL=1
MNEILASIDVGTSKTAVIIAERNNGEIDVRGFAVAPTEGVVRGIVVNIEKTEQAILRALSNAEKQAQLKVKKIIASYGGNQTKVVKSHGITSIPKERGTITLQDTVKLIDAARNISLPHNTQIIDYAVKDFIIDSNSGIEDPIGMTASRFEADVLLFLTQTPPVSNLIKTLNNIDLTPTDIIVSPIASAKAILTDEEKELGAVMIDIGAGTTDVVIYKTNRPQTVFAIPFAGESVTHDLIVGLKLPRIEAEKLKQTHGCALQDEVDENEVVEIMGIGGREPRMVDKKFIAMIMEARLEEIFSMVKEKSVENGVEMNSDNFPAGIVLVGGTTLTSKLVYLVEKVLNMPVRVGLPGDRIPLPQGMNTPDYHIAWGALLIAAERHQIDEKLELDKGKIPIFWNKVKNWILKRL